MSIQLVDITQVATQWLVFLDSWLPCSYPDDLAIKLYNASENGFDEWTEFLSASTTIDGKSVYIDEVLSSDDLLDEFTDAALEILINPLDRFAAEYGYENMEIISAKVVRCVDNSIVIYATVKVEDMQ